MVWEFAAAQSAGDVGTRPATHTTDAAPRPVSVEAPPMSWHDLHGSECRLQLAGSKCAPLPADGVSAGRGGGGWAAKRSGAYFTCQSRISECLESANAASGGHTGSRAPARVC